MRRNLARDLLGETRNRFGVPDRLHRPLEKAELPLVKEEVASRHDRVPGRGKAQRIGRRDLGCEHLRRHKGEDGVTVEREKLRKEKDGIQKKL